MKALLLILLILPLSYSQHIVELVDKYFESLLQGYTTSLILFYAPWSDWSRSMLPEYETAKLKLSIKNSKILFAKTDSSTNPVITSKFDVQDFPTLLLLNGESTHKYDGGAQPNQIVNFVNRHLNQYALINTSDELKKYLEHKDQLFIGFLPYDDDDAALNTFRDAAKYIDEVLFVHTHSKEVVKSFAKDFDLTFFEVPRGAVFAPHSDEPTIYEGSFTNLSEIITFVNSYRLPAVVPFDADSAASLFKQRRTIVFLLLNGVDHNQTEMETFETVANHYRTKLIFSVSSGTEDPSARRLYDMLGIDESDFPCVRAATANPNGSNFWHPVLKYSYHGSLTDSAELGEWLKQMDSQLLAPYVKSEADNNYSGQKGPVWIATANTFNQLVTMSSSDVVVLFHTPWCGSCRKIEPFFKSVAEKFQNSSTLQFVKIDGSQNEVTQLHLSSFPSILMFPAHTKSRPIKANVGIESERDLMVFIKESASYPVQIEITDRLLDL
eukprot:GHVL01005338.1.p1 GENE.GHVL01005338.1~~GHVL01005338.1.p1  ORF type:complete len:496 (+),score=43.26 GHVL01005338.1:2962-4449(+)